MRASVRRSRRFWRIAIKSWHSRELPVLARRRRSRRSEMRRNVRGTKSKASRRPHVPRISWPRPASSRTRCSIIWVRGEQDVASDDQKRLYVLDESSLASTKQMHTFLERLGPDDRVLLVGDVRQHEAVDAGRPYHQLQQAGVRTAHLDEIVRHRDLELKADVEQLSRGDVQGAGQRLY